MSSRAQQLASEQSWRDLQRKLKSLPEQVRRKQVTRILRREARPLVWAARKAAYDGSQETAMAGKKSLRKNDGGNWYNLFSTINVFPNKKNKDYQYVVVGTRSIQKKPRGALYAQWQNLGGMGNKTGGFAAKRFFDKAEQNYGTDVHRKALRSVNREIEKILKSTFR